MQWLGAASVVMLAHHGAEVRQAGLLRTGPRELLLDVLDPLRVEVQALTRLGEVDAQAVDRDGHAEVHPRHYDDANVIAARDSNAPRLGQAAVYEVLNKVHGASVAAR